MSKAGFKESVTLQFRVEQVSRAGWQLYSLLRVA